MQGEEASCIVLLQLNATNPSGLAQVDLKEGTRLEHSVCLTNYGSLSGSCQ